MKVKNYIYIKFITISFIILGILGCGQTKVNKDIEAANKYLSETNFLKPDDTHYYLLISVDCASCRYPYIQAILKKLEKEQYTIITSDEIKSSFDTYNYFSQENKKHLKIVTNEKALATLRCMRSQICLVESKKGIVDTVIIVTGDNYNKL